MQHSSSADLLVLVCAAAAPGALQKSIEAATELTTANWMFTELVCRPSVLHGRNCENGL